MKKLSKALTILNICLVVINLIGAALLARLLHIQINGVNLGYVATTLLLYVYLTAISETFIKVED